MTSDRNLHENHYYVRQKNGLDKSREAYVPFKNNAEEEKTPTTDQHDSGRSHEDRAYHVNQDQKTLPQRGRYASSRANQSGYYGRDTAKNSS